MVKPTGMGKQRTGPFSATNIPGESTAYHQENRVAQQEITGRRH